MSEHEIEQDESEVVVDELSILKGRATQLGITFSPNIGLAKLKEKVAEAMAEEKPTPKPKVADTVTEFVETQRSIDNRLRSSAQKLVRIRVNCMNPNKRDWEGEIFTVSNSVVGTIKKYVPFNAEDGWHVPQFILNVMRERECQVFTTVKGPRGNKVRKGKLIKEFAIEILDPLTPKELADLAATQAAARNLD